MPCTFSIEGEHATVPVTMMKPLQTRRTAERLVIRAAAKSDLPALIALDTEVTGTPKRQYWRESFASTRSRRSRRFILVAEKRGRIEGFISGEIRSWEFGEPSCGWVFAIQVRPGSRLEGTATILFEALCEKFRRAGVTKVRTMMARDNHLVLSFFRSQGMMAGPFIELEAALD
jgi:GNAT superfamily N-acetyltransferase